MEGTRGRKELEKCTLELVNESRYTEFYESENIVNVLARSGGVIERYARHYTELLLHFRWDEAGEYGILLHRPFVGVDRATATRKPEHRIAEPGHRCDDCAVLVGVPVLLQAPHGEITVRVRSEARLVRFDQVLHRLIHPLHITRRITTPQVGTIENGELCSSTRSASRLQDKLPSQMIESGTEIIEDITNHREGRWLDGLPFDFPDLVTRVRVKLTNDSIWWDSPELVELGFELLQVFTGPCYLDPDTFEFLHMLYSHHEREETQDSENFQRLRDTDPDQGRRIQGAAEGGRAYRERLRDPQPPGEGLAQTGKSLRSDSSISKHTHSGSLEDA